MQHLQDVSIPFPTSAPFAPLTRPRYKPDVRLRFITEELGFESDADAAQFVVDHNGQHLLEERQGPDGSDIVFLTGKAGLLFESQKAEAFRRVDIKGQI